MAPHLHKVSYAGRRLFRVHLRPQRTTVAKTIIDDIRDQASLEHWPSHQVEDTVRYQLAVAGCLPPPRRAPTTSRCLSVRFAGRRICQPRVWGDTVAEAYAAIEVVRHASLADNLSQAAASKAVYAVLRKRGFLTERDAGRSPALRGLDRVFAVGGAPRQILHGAVEGVPRTGRADMLEGRSRCELS